MLAGKWQDLIATNYTAAELVQIEPALATLYGTKLQPTAYSGPAWQAATLKLDARARVATVAQGADIYLALPLQQKKFPLPHSQNVITALGGTGLPLIENAMPTAAWNVLLESQGQPLLLRQVPVDGPFFQMIKSQSGHFSVIEQWQRAGLRPVGEFETWMDLNFERKRRKEYRRLRNRLAEEGELKFETLPSGADCLPWLNALLTLEAAGWKGQRGTALSSDEKAVPALQAAAQTLHAAGQWRMWRLTLNGKTIAAMYSVVDGDEAWLGKIAFDEAYAKYSPGVMLILDATEALFGEKNIRLVDSCAIPGHPMIDNIWRDRIAIADVMVAAPGVSAVQFKATLSAELIHRRLRNFARDVYYKLKGRRRS